MPNKLRICHIITKLELGGAQQNTLYTVSHLNRDQFETSLISGEGGILDEDAKHLAVPIYFIPSLIRSIHPFKDIWAGIRIYQRLRELKPHVVHTHSSKAGILGRISAYLAGVPVIIHTFHGFGFTPAQKPWVRRCYVGIEKLCALLSTHLIFVSEQNQREAGELGIGTHISHSLIRSGIGIVMDERRQTSIRKELGISDTAWVVTSVGNFKPQKNPLDLVRTAAAVLEKSPGTHFLLAGDGELRTQAEALAKEKNIADRVHFLGWRARDARALLTESNAFLLTSLWEGLPRSVVEAFAASLPVVAYGVDGVRDILVSGENGFLIPPGEHARAAEQLLYLEAHPEEAKRMGQAGRERIREEFDIDRMVQQQDFLYHDLYAKVPLKDYYEPLWNMPA